jgi:hypothetical protein
MTMYRQTNTRFADVFQTPLATTRRGPATVERCTHHPKPVRLGSRPRVITVSA